MKRFFAPETVQSSAMDCGPAALKTLLEGFHIPVSYDRLREACQTDVDGTCIDTLEVVANQLGLMAEQIMLPLDHVLIPEAKALPALLVVQLPDGLTHFVVVWRQHGSWLQVMDPAVGRRWVPAKRFLDEVYRHRMPVPAADWREFAASDDFQTVLRSRMRRAGINAPDAVRLCQDALRDPSWKALAALDAAVRLVTSLRSAKAVTSKEAVRMVAAVQAVPELIPAGYWAASPAEPDEEGGEQVSFCGAVLLSISGKRTDVAPEATTSTEIRAAAAEKPLCPVAVLATELWHAAGPVSLALFAVGLLFSSAGVLVEALLFRSLLDLASELHVAGQRAAASGAVLAVSAALLALDLALTSAGARFGRKIEAQLRVAFLNKMPKLGDRYFQSRLISDMAARSHVTHQLRQIPNLARVFAGALLKLCFTAAAMMWLEPSAWPGVLLITAIALIAPALTQAMLNERDLRVRSQAGALTRFLLDGMLGLVAIKAHGAERNIRTQQTKLLGCWAEAALRLQKTAVLIEAIQISSMFALTIWLLLSHRMQVSEIGRVLLVIYWALNLPTYGQDLCRLARTLPYYRNLTLRLIDPLRAPEEDRPPVRKLLRAAPSIRFQDVSVTSSGHPILQGIDLDIKSGAHVAVVGPSGAGKSSLVGLLLGWSKASSGELKIDGAPIDCESLRNSSVWIDPGVHVWNRSLFANISYGNDANPEEIGQAIDDAMLRGVLESLPDGLQTNLGEGGGFVSGGEGQRVRVARAMVRHNARLAILDEPFRGLDGERRSELLLRARKLWRECTLICVTHDMRQTLDFDQVIVMEQGGVVEQGNPRELASRKDSRYAELLRAEAHAGAALWSARNWRRIRVKSGRLVEAVQGPTSLHEAEVA